MELYAMQSSEPSIRVDAMIKQLTRTAKRYWKEEYGNEDKEVKESELMHGSMVVYGILKVIEGSIQYSLDNKYGTIMELIRKYKPEESMLLEEDFRVFVFLGVREFEENEASVYFPEDKLKVVSETVKEKFGVNTASESQNEVRKLLEKIFFQSPFDIQEEYPFHGLYLDFYIPELKLAIEFDGRQHFEFTPKFHKTEQDFSSQRRRDCFKDKLCRENGIALVRITYLDPVCKSWLRERINQALKEFGDVRYRI